MALLKTFFRLAAPFWTGPTRRGAWLRLFGVVACALLFVQVSVSINAWNKTFYDALAAFDGTAAARLSLQFLGYLVVASASIAVGGYLSKALIFRWREHLTEDVSRRWLAGRRYYHLTLSDTFDNPDQRIAEDLALLAQSSVTLFKSLVMNSTRLVAFVLILWGLSPPLTVKIGEGTLTIQGYLVWIALVYSAFSTWLIHRIGRPLLPLSIERQHREADYRATLLRLRDHAEQIAFHRGEAAERGRLDSRFSHIRANWFALIRREFALESFTSIQMRLGLLVPIVAALPPYFAHRITFGTVMQAQGAFSNVADGFGWFVTYYRQLVEWAAVVRRVGEFSFALDSNRAVFPAEDSRVASTPRLTLDRLEISTPDGAIVQAPITLDIQGPGWLLVDGPSGCGKTTLLRVVAGLWSPRSGECRVSGETLFLPQRPYAPEGSLRETLSYTCNDPPDDVALMRVLAATGLDHLGPLDRQETWARILSGGELQRLAVARALLSSPQILCLDEATSQLDAPTALAMMRLIERALPACLVIAVTHQAEIKRLFDRHLDMAALGRVAMA